MRLKNMKVVVKGGGEIASAIAHRLTMAGFRICMTEIGNPLAVHRGTTFSEAVYHGQKEVEGLTAKLIQSPVQAIAVWRAGKIPVLVDPEAACIKVLKPKVLVDARMLKKKTDTDINDAPLVIGIGPGFTAGRDVHLVVESYHDEKLGRIIQQGKALANNAIPVSIGGYTFERALHAEKSGYFKGLKRLGEGVKKGDVVALLDDNRLRAQVDGVIRAILPSGIRVPKGTKLIELDPEASPEVCYIIRAKMRAVAGGVLEAIMYWFNN